MRKSSKELNNFEDEFPDEVNNFEEPSSEIVNPLLNPSHTPSQNTADVDFGFDNDFNEVPVVSDNLDDSDDIANFLPEDDFAPIDNVATPASSDTLPSFDEDIISNTNNEAPIDDNSDTLPGFDDATNTDTLPGFDNANNADTLPGFDNATNTDTLPGFDDATNTDTLPGFDDANNADTLPGFDSQAPYQDSNVQNGFDANAQNPYQDPNAQVGFGYDQNPYQDPNSQAGFGYDQNPYQDPNSQVGFGYDQNPYQDPNAQVGFGYDQNNPYQDPNAQAGFGYNQNNPYQDPNAQAGFGYDQNNPYQDPNAQPGFDVNAQNEQYQDPNGNMNFEQNQQTFGEDYNIGFVQNWMGKLYDKAHSKKFNWSAAIFGVSYLIFRKMYLTGFLLYALIMIISVLSSYLVIVKHVVFAGALVAFLPLLSFFGLGLGFYPMYRNFVKGKLNKYKKSITDNNQLLSVATQKGGTSILSVIGMFLLTGILSSAISTVIISKAAIDLGNILGGLSNSVNNEITINNGIPEEPPEVELSKFNFVDNYVFTYDSSNWFVDQSTGTLTYGETASLAYVAKYEGESLQLDLSSSAGMSSLLEMLNASLVAQAGQTNLQVQPQSSNFILANTCYYAYTDVIDTSANTSYRYYFIVFPEDNIFFQFVLTVADTSIDYKINTTITNDMLTNISTLEFPTANSPVDTQEYDLQDSEQQTLNNESDNQPVYSNQEDQSLSGMLN